MITVIDYWAPWCGPCKTMLPILEKLEEEYNVPGSGVEIKRVNVDEEPDEAKESNIRSIPTLIFKMDGLEVDRRVGVIQHGKLKEFIENLKN